MSSQGDFQALYRQVESHLDILTDEISSMLFEKAFPDFLKSEDYLRFTEAPEGSKAIKKLKGIYNQKLLGHLKKSYQEFDFHHLYKLDERKKYGKKFLDTLKSHGVMNSEEYKKLLPFTMTLPAEGEEDPLEYRMITYYMRPVYDENLVKFRAIKSGNSLFESYLQQNHSTTDLFYTSLVLDIVETMKAIRQHQGVVEALTYFRDNIYEESLSDSELLKYMGNDRQLARQLKEQVKKPLELVMFSLKRKLQAGTQTSAQAKTKSINIHHGMKANKNFYSYAYKPRENKSKEIYWT